MWETRVRSFAQKKAKHGETRRQINERRPKTTKDAERRRQMDERRRKTTKDDERRQKTLTLSVTLCGLTGPKTQQGGPGLGGSVHEEAHPCFPYFAQRTFKSIDAGGFHRRLVQLIPPINYSIRKEIFTTVPCAPKLN